MSLVNVTPTLKNSHRLQYIQNRIRLFQIYHRVACRCTRDEAHETEALVVTTLGIKAYRDLTRLYASAGFGVRVARFSSPACDGPCS